MEVAVDEGAAVAVGVAVEVGMAAIPEGAAAPDLSQGFGGEAMYCPGCLSSVALTRWRVVRSTAMMWPMFDVRWEEHPFCAAPGVSRAETGRAVGVAGADSRFDSRQWRTGGEERNRAGWGGRRVTGARLMLETEGER